MILAETIPLKWLPLLSTNFPWNMQPTEMALSHILSTLMGSLSPTHSSSPERSVTAKQMQQRRRGKQIIHNSYTLSLFVPIQPSLLPFRGT